MKRNIFCLESKIMYLQNFKLKKSLFYLFHLAERALPLVRKGLDIICIPTGCESVKDHVHLRIKKGLLEPWQVIWVDVGLSSILRGATTGELYSMHYFLDNQIIPRLGDLILAYPGEYTFFPNANSDELELYRNRLEVMGITTATDSMNMFPRWGSKLILHSGLENMRTPSRFQEITEIPSLPGVSITPGSERAGILAMQQRYGKHVFVKGALGAAGSDIFEVTGGIDTEFLQKMSRVSEKNKGLVIEQACSPGHVPVSVQVFLGKVVSVTEQTIVNNAHTGNIFPVTSVQGQILEEMTTRIQRFVDATGLQFGGFDFFVLPDTGEYFISDNNVARWVSPHGAYLLCERYNCRAFMYGETPCIPDLENYLGVLASNGLGFDPSKGAGVVVFSNIRPSSDLPETLSGSLIAAYAANRELATEMFERAKSLIPEHAIA